MYVPHFNGTKAADVTKEFKDQGLLRFTTNFLISSFQIDSFRLIHVSVSYITVQYLYTDKMSTGQYHIHQSEIGASHRAILVISRSKKGSFLYKYRIQNTVRVHLFTVRVNDFQV